MIYLPWLRFLFGAAFGRMFSRVVVGTRQNRPVCYFSSLSELHLYPFAGCEHDMLADGLLDLRPMAD
jgi:hypothetical protein